MSREQEIYLGAMGEKNLELAGQISDGAIVTMYPLSKISQALEVLERSGANGERSRSKELFAYVPLKIAENAEDAETARSEVARNIGSYIASMGEYYARNLAVLGFERNVEKILRTHSQADSKAATAAVDDELIEELSLIDSVDEIKEKLLKLPKGVVPVFAVDSPPSF